MVGTARCLLKANQLPGVFWGEAVTMTVYLLNRSSSKSIGGKTPYKLWTGTTPGVQHLGTFGCIAHVKLTTPNQKKLDDRSKRTIFIGYELGSKAYRLYDHRHVGSASARTSSSTNPHSGPETQSSGMLQTTSMLKRPRVDYLRCSQ